MNNLQVKKAAARRMMPKRRPKTRPRIPPRPIFAVGGGAVTQARRGTRKGQKSGRNKSFSKKW